MKRPFHLALAVTLLAAPALAAEIYAKAAGVTLGEPISIAEDGAAVPVFRGKMAAPMAAGAQVAPGEETLSVTVSVSWAIKAKE